MRLLRIMTKINDLVKLPVTLAVKGYKYNQTNNSECPFEQAFLCCNFWVLNIR